MAKMGFNKNYSISRVVSKLVYTILALYVGGTIMNAFGDTMNGTASAFYEGLTLIGWTITDSTDCNQMTPSANNNNCITDTTGSGVLAVIGIIGLAGVVLEFISFK